MTSPHLTASRLRELLDYDPDTGVFRWRLKIGRSIVGNVAGCRDRLGYVVITIDKRHYFAHRLALLYVNGAFPTNHIDHRNGVTNDNRLSNLRDVTVSENMQNQRGPRSNNISGYLGVSPHYGKWNARIMVNGDQRKLGRFATAREAYAAYLKAKRELHSACTI
jgi:hypothetical protein